MRLDKYLKVSRLVNVVHLLKKLVIKDVTINGNVAKAGTDVKWKTN